MMRKRLEYGLLLLAVTAFHIFFIGYLSFYVFAFFLTLPVISLLTGLLAGRGVEVEVEMKDGPVRKNEAVPVRVKVRSSFLLPCRVRVRIVIRNELLPEERKETLLYILAGRREQTLVQTLSSQYCGRLDCSIGELRIVDYLGLLSFHRKTDGRQCYAACHTALVLPSVYPLKETDNDSKIRKDIEGGDPSQRKAGDDPSELFDIREYREGDRLTRIHWKLSDKYENLMIKDYGHTGSNDVLLLFDLMGGGREMDGLLDTVRSVSGFLLDHQVAHEIEWYNSLNGCFVHTGIARKDDLDMTLNAVLSKGRPQPRPLALMNCGGEGHGRYADCIYLCSGTGFTADAIALLCERMTGSRIRILAVTAEPAVLREKDASRAAARMADLTVIDLNDIGKSLSALSL